MNKSFGRKKLKTISVLNWEQIWPLGKKFKRLKTIKNQRIFKLKNLAERERPHLLLRDPEDRGDTAMLKSAVYKIFIWVFDFYLLCQIQKIQQCWSLQISPIVIWYLSHRLYQIQKLLQCQILQYLKINIFTSVNNN